MACNQSLEISNDKASDPGQVNGKKKKQNERIYLEGLSGVNRYP